MVKEEDEYNGEEDDEEIVSIEPDLTNGLFALEFMDGFEMVKVMGMVMNIVENNCYF